MDGGADSLFTGSLGVICGCVCATCVISASDQRQHSPASPSFGQRQQIVVDSGRCVSVWRAVVNNNRVRRKKNSSFGYKK